MVEVYEDLIGYDDSNHSPEIFNRINVNDTVIILPIFENGLLLMVEGYRHGAGEDLLEFPGGFIDKNMKNHHSGARREFFEETKYTCDSIKFVNWFYTWPGRELHRKIMYL